MTEPPLEPTGLDSILALLANRYVENKDGRLMATRNDGIPPRFVLGRSAEGCLWRFGSSLDPDRVRAIAKLAGREPAFPIAGKGPAMPPERLAMIERLLSVDGGEAVAQHEILRRGPDPIAELWTIR